MTLAAPRLFRLAMYLASLVIILDQLTKVWIFEGVLADQDKIVVAPFFTLVKWLNPGVSFSFLSIEHAAWPWILSVLGLIITTVLTIWLARVRQPMPAIGLALVIGGALGNIVDRLQIGKVRDFLLFHWDDLAWPAFNLADSAITVGVAVLLVDGFFFAEKRKHQDSSQEG